MGSLLPGWDSEPMKPPLGLHDELVEERLELEKKLHVSKRLSVDSPAAVAVVGPPALSRKSAPSAFVVKKLQEKKRDEGDDSALRFTLEVEEEAELDVSPKAVASLYSRDKWWKKFSSAHLNEMAREAEKESGQHTYTPQFELAGGDPYIKAKK